MSLQYLKKKSDIKSIFCMQTSFLQVEFSTLGIKTFYKVIRLLVIAKIKYSGRSQSNKFSISLHYLKK